MLSPAAIDTLFARFQARKPDENTAPEAKLAHDPFASLVGVMLSAQSRDAMTERARRSLFAIASTPEAILELSEERIGQLIKDCGLYRLKARNLKRMCATLLDRHGGLVPSTRIELMALPGVGRKSADIMLRFVFGEAEVPVDTHVFRVSSRLGLASGRTEAALAKDLSTRIPPNWRWGAHIWLLEHGKEICRSRRPRCSACFLADLCERNGVANPA